MNPRAKLFIFGVAVCAALVISFHPWGRLSGMSEESVRALLSLAAIGALSEILAIHYSVGSGKAVSSIVFIPYLASAILLPPSATLLVVLFTQTFSQVLHKRKFWKGLFNVTQAVLSIACGVAIYESFGGVPGIRTSMAVMNFVAMSFAFFAVNQVLSSVALTLLTQDRFSSVLLQVIGKSGSNLLYDVLVSPLAVIVVFLYGQWHGAGILLVVFPLLLIRHSYASNHELRQANKDLLQVLIKAIETRDPYTSGHSVRVSILARTIAEDLELPPHKIDDIHTAALVHDIGKVDLIYSEIIQKKAGLTDAERKVIVTHAAKGAEFLRTLTSVKEYVIAGVRHHHEHYDGTGYPDRLAGEEIPLPSRIIMLSDSIDAMLSDRPYRKALSISQVRQEILRCSGSQFDPKIVQSILKRKTLERAAELVPEQARQSSRPISVAV